MWTVPEVSSGIILYLTFPCSKCLTLFFFHHMTTAKWLSYVWLFISLRQLIKKHPPSDYSCASAPAPVCFWASLRDPSPFFLSARCVTARHLEVFEPLYVDLDHVPLQRSNRALLWAIFTACWAISAVLASIFSQSSRGTSFLEVD